MRAKRGSRILVAALIVALSAAPAMAGFSGSDLFVPMASRAAGVFPSDWYTTLWIHNRGATPAVVRVFFLERGTANIDPPSADLVVEGGDTVRVDNVVQTLFQREGFGALRITCATETIVVSSRTYSKGPQAGERDSVGQDFAGVPASFAIGAGEKTRILGVHQTLPATESDNRFNFGFVETTGHSVLVRVHAYEAGRVYRGFTDLQVRELSQRQVAFKDRFPGVSSINTSLEVEVLSGHGRVIAYGSSVANGSQDPTTFEMEYPAEVLAGGPQGVTSVVAGQGLFGGGGPGSVTLHVGEGSGISVNADTVAIAAGGVTTDKMADGAITAAKVSAAGSVAGQSLVSTGDAVAWGAPQGPQGPPGPSGPAGPAGPPGPAGVIDSPGFVRTVIASGSSPSVTIGADGLGLVAFVGTDGSLRTSHCHDVACSSVMISTLDVGPVALTNRALVIGADGLGFIAYYDTAAQDLKAAHCVDRACSAASVTTIESAGVVGHAPSAALGADGLPLVAYQDWTQAQLKTAHCSDPACASSSIAVLDATTGVGKLRPSLTIGADGMPLVSFMKWDLATRALRVARCADVACSSASAVTIVESGDLDAEWNSIALGVDGLALIAYGTVGGGARLRLARCADSSCASVDAGAVVQDDQWGGQFCLAMGSDGLALLAYYSESAAAYRVAHCTEATCSSATSVAIDAATDGYTIALVIGADRLPLIAYSDTATNQVKVTHCSNPMCVPFVRRP